MWTLTDEEKKILKERVNFSCAKIDSDEPGLPLDKTPIEKIHTQLICHCKYAEGKNLPVISEGNWRYGFDYIKCPYCRKRAKAIDTTKKVSSITSPGFFYVKHCENGFLIYSCKIRVSYDKRKDEIKDDISIISVVKFEIGEGATVETSSGKEKMMDVFDALRINSKTIKIGADVFYKDSNGLIDFFLKNEEINKKTGFLSFYEFGYISSNSIHRDILFFLYVYLLSTYPAIELLVKMGYVSLIRTLVYEISLQPNKINMKEKIISLNSLIMNTTKGSFALAFPKYVAEYLNDINADLRSYEAFAVLYAYQPLSKEQFFALIDNPDFQENYEEKDYLFENLKYGYKLEKELSYLMKQKRDEETTIARAVIELKDYNEMSNIIGSTTGDYPSDLSSAHDNVAIAFKIKMYYLQEAQIKKIAERAREYAIDDKNYAIVLPESTYDFIQEGKNQHNCVASYAQKVANRECIVFFIRKQNNPEESYITAEYNTWSKRLTHIFYKYNQQVSNPVEKEFAKKYCSLLQKNQDKIFAGV